MGMVTEPVVTVFPTEDPDTIPQRAEEITDTFAGPPAKRPAIEFANSMKNLVKIAKSNITYNITKSNSVKNKSLQNQVKKNVLNSAPTLNIEYKPSIAINYTGEAKPTQIKQDFEYLIKKHKNEILNLVRKEQERLYRLAY